MSSPESAAREHLHSAGSQWSKIWRENGLSITLLAMFLIVWVGQALAGWKTYNEDRRRAEWPEVSFISYLGTGHFWEATGENWESEFLQMGAFVWLTAFLFQKGSPESNDPYHEEPEAPVTDQSPWPVRKGGWARTLYENSLSLTFLLLFALSLLIHLIAGRIEHNEEQLQQGGETVSTGRFLLSSDFWFQSLQNWQSEFFSIAAMVILAIFLRQKHSPESKDPAVPHSRNE